MVKKKKIKEEELISNVPDPIEITDEDRQKTVDK